MSFKHNFSDEFIASALKKDARDSSIRYSALGLQAFLPKRPTSNAPKPNTRFLRNIIRETDSHNSALLAKEAEDSRLRLRQLRAVENSRYWQGKLEYGRQDGAYGGESGEDSRHSERRRVAYSEDADINFQSDLKPKHRRRRRFRSTSRRRKDDSEPRKGGELEHYRHRHRSQSRDDTSRHQSSRHRSRRRHKGIHSPSISPKRRGRSGVEDGHSRRKKPSRRSYSASQSPRHLNRPSLDPEEHTSRSTASQNKTLDRPERTLSPTRKTATPQSPESGSESDPLESIIGPPIPTKLTSPQVVRSRGRGSNTYGSGIDSRFSRDYDPRIDARPNSDSEAENDWDQVLEALRDRTRWKLQGAERLRSAGFSEEDVAKWEKGGEKTEEDVKWSKRGEGREWDRGKVVDLESGEVGTAALWGVK
ncbi:MAG: hypothetical protein M1829_005532 [Trizodia sp. TS-e1964]|nr:MAG: hypothetical protein M1829_005532 [Trizodia sp. TS-e1964]